MHRIPEFAWKLLVVGFTAGVAWGVSSNVAASKLDTERFVLDSARRAIVDTIIVDQLREIRRSQDELLTQQLKMIRSLCGQRLGGCQ